jgi:hypothetical protein
VVTCPAGHESADVEFCDVCGADMGGSAAAAPASEPAPTGEAELCPRCGTPRSDRFCEEDGYDFVLGAARSPSTATAQLGVVTPHITPHTAPAAATPAASPPASPTGADWSAVVAADRAYYDSVIAEAGSDAERIAFPPYCPDRVVPLTGSQIRIGRRSVSRGVIPEIDLGETPEDIGVSHTHAVLLSRPDGTWVLVDPGSTNGTTINGATDPIPVNAEIVVGDGDRIHVGAWTTITLRKE